MPYLIKNNDPKVICHMDHSKAEAECDQNCDKTDAEITKIVNANDILPGRGKHVYGHHGNRIFLSLVKDNDLKHSSSPNYLKKEQAKIIFATMRNLDPPGRFLKPFAQADGEELWQEMSKEDALTKIRQAMRDNTRRNNTQSSKFMIDATNQNFINNMKFRSNRVGDLSSYSMNQDRGLRWPGSNIPFIHQMNGQALFFPPHCVSYLQCMKSRNMLNSANLNPEIGTVANTFKANASMIPLSIQANQDARGLLESMQPRRTKLRLMSTRFAK